MTLDTPLTKRYDTIVSTVVIGPHALDILRPRSTDDLLDEAELDPQQRLPYWAEIWPSSLVLARRLLAEDSRGRRLLELGCGLGVAALVAARAGFAVVASDYFAPALEFVRHNAQRNDVAHVGTRLFDWRKVPEDLGCFDVIAAADVLYERGNTALVADVIVRLLAPGGLAIVSDPGRMLAEGFCAQCAQRGLSTVRAGQETQPDGSRVVTVDLFELRREAPAG